MGALRWILLVGGIVFLAALTAWELRKPRQAHRDSQIRGPRRNEPELGSFPESGGDDGPVACARSDVPAARSNVPPTRSDLLPGASAGRRPIVPPPHFDLPAADLPAMQASRDEAMMAEVNALPVFEFRAADYDPPAPMGPAAPDTDADPTPVALPPTLTGDLPAPLVVDWPPDGERQIVALRIVAPSEERLSGRAVRLAITACGFVHGRFGIYHQPDVEGRALLSVASLVKPGILDPINMDFQRLPGISLFTVLPGPLPPPDAFDRLLDVARELSQRLPARLQDEQGEPLDSERVEALRASMQRLSRPGWQAEPAA